jgi:adenine phosphoribosyltransferase
LEIHQDAFAAGDRVLVVDDVLATGGTVSATSMLVERGGGSVAAVAVLIELGFLSGRDKLGGAALTSLLTA